MRAIMTPGYKSLFGEPSILYDEVLKEVSSQIVIMLLSSLNAELNTPEKNTEKQKRIWQRVSYRFTEEQHRKFKVAFSKYNVLVNGFDGTLFDRRCLLEMIVKEIRRNNICNEIDDPVHEYNFVIAYLLLVDEVRKVDSELLENAKECKDEAMPTLPLLWAGGIRQYEFNHNVNILYELFKLYCFSKYAYDKFRPYLKELINKYSFQNLSQFIGSFNQILKVTLIDNPAEPLRKLVSINPSRSVNDSHLKALCCNSLIGNNKVVLADLRKYPLYETTIRGFMIVDADFFRKKIYRGPLFELQKETELRNMVIRFDDYKTIISKEFFEKIFFRSIVKIMIKSKYEIVHFDDNVSSKPDLFYRYNKSVLLIEFKDYLFPDKIMAGKEFATFKQYIDERFVLSDREKPKGVKQLVNSIENIYKMNCEFDLLLNDIVKKKQQVKIYPVICHTDFMFSLPGINEYLNVIFGKKLKEKELESNDIRNVTIISLEILFDYSMRGGDFTSLSKLIERYWGIIDNRKKKNRKFGSVDNFLATTASFDELYETKFKQELLNNHQLSKKNRVTQLIEMAGLTQEQLNEIL